MEQDTNVTWYDEDISNEAHGLCLGDPHRMQHVQFRKFNYVCMCVFSLFFDCIPNIKEYIDKIYYCMHSKILIDRYIILHIQYIASAASTTRPDCLRDEPEVHVRVNIEP